MLKTTDLRKSWLIYLKLASLGFYTGQHAGPTLEAKGAIVVAPCPPDMPVEAAAPKYPAGHPKTGVSAKSFEALIQPMEMFLGSIFFCKVSVCQNNETILYILEDLVVCSFKLVNTARSTMLGKGSVEEKEKEKEKEKENEKEKQRIKDRQEVLWQKVMDRRRISVSIWISFMFSHLSCF